MSGPDTTTWPERFADEAALEELMITPADTLRAALARVDGDIIVLGVGGKMGPTLAGLAKRAAPDKRVVGVARFTDPRVRDKLAAWGVETIQCDLTDRHAVAGLPRLPNVVFMAGRKFGAVGDDDVTWAMNTYVPAVVAETFHESGSSPSPRAASIPSSMSATRGRPRRRRRRRPPANTPIPASVANG